MRATLFGIPASHPSLAGQLMLEHKGVEYRRIDLVAGPHRALLRALGFPGKTVPAVRLDGAKIQGTTEIALALDALVPETAAASRRDPERRREVEEAEAWGNEVLQPVPRRLVWNGLGRDRSELATYLEGARARHPNVDRGPHGAADRDARAPPQPCHRREPRGATSPRCPG